MLKIAFNFFHSKLITGITVSCSTCAFSCRKVYQLPKIIPVKSVFSAAGSRHLFRTEWKTVVEYLPKFDVTLDSSGVDMTRQSSATTLCFYDRIDALRRSAGMFFI